MKSKAAPFNQTSGGEEGSAFLFPFFCPNQGQFEIASLQKKKVPVHIKREVFIHVNTWLILQECIIHQQTAFRGQR